MKQLILTIFFATVALLGTEQAYGQMVYKNSDGKVILDCSAKSKMLQKAVTRNRKYVANTGPSNSQFILGTLDAANAANEKIYYMLEIAPQEIRNDGTLGEGEIMSWADAYNRCKKIGGGGQGWRLPTQRELQMMWIFRDAFASLGCPFKCEPDYYCYWSATESDASIAYVLYFNIGRGMFSEKYNEKVASLVRCVREVTP